jgi:glycogen debranching enzyme
LHEVRLGEAVNTALGGKDTYFGSIDATPLYVVAVEELNRWGLDPADAEDLLAHADRCLEWIDRYGDRDGDGFVEYERSSPAGLVNQGWKDSWDAIAFADGTIAAPPIALCEVQGYVYAAYRARAALARDGGDADVAQQWEGRATHLKAEFNARFWLPDRGYFAIALDRNKQPVDACASNMGQCLWSGIVDDAKAEIVADRLMAPDMFSGWGIRTLSSEMAAFNPASYHNGSVWPHDNALIAAGLMNYGFVDHAQRVALALFDAAAHFDGRLPELFCGFSRGEYSHPVPYPNACSPQAWAAATPFSLIRTLLQLDVDVHRKWIALAPELPPELGRIRIDNLLVGGARIGVEVAPGGARVMGMPPGFTVERGLASRERMP